MPPATKKDPAPRPGLDALRIAQHQPGHDHPADQQQVDAETPRCPDRPVLEQHGGQQRSGDQRPDEHREAEQPPHRQEAEEGVGLPAGRKRVPGGPAVVDTGDIGGHICAPLPKVAVAEEQRPGDEGDDPARPVGSSGSARRRPRGASGGRGRSASDCRGRCARWRPPPPRQSPGRPGRGRRGRDGRASPPAPAAAAGRAPRSGCGQSRCQARAGARRRGCTPSSGRRREAG